MTDLRQVNRQFLLEFIELYRNHPCIWKIKSREYSDRVKKKKAYEKLLAKLKEVDPDATVEVVKKKIDALRAGYRRELRKVKESKKNASDSNDIYVPNLWYFEELLFLNERDNTSFSGSNLGDEGNSVKDDQDSNECQSEEENQFLWQSASTSGPMTSKSSAKRSRVSCEVSCDGYLSGVNEKLNNEIVQAEDEFDIVGKNVANKLRKLSAETATIAEKFIMDILFEACLGNLNRHSKLNIS